MAFELPDLGYGYDALEPVIDEITMKVHHDLHHGGYVKKLNEALEEYEDLKTKGVEELIGDLDALPMEIEAAVRNNGGGHANHSLFWKVMKKGGGGKPKGKLVAAIKKNFGSISKFKDEFTNKALGQFGSGWGWLVVEGSSAGSGQGGKLHVCSTPNQDNPWMEGNTPILGLDVWEHAYYLKYQNSRPEYVENWWKVVNWEEVEKRYEAALSSKS